MKKAREPLSASLPDLRGAKLTRRVILFLLALAVAVGAFAFGVRGLLSADPGWTVIEADGSGGLSCANEFVLRVDLGAGGRDPGGDRRGAIAAYTRAAARAWQLFTPDSPVEETVNIWWLNAHPNTEVPVEPLLYRALSSSLAGGRHLYLGPLYENADALFASQSDAEAAACDPRLNADTAAFTAQVLSYIQDPAHITLELLDDSRVCLRVSDDYRAFALEQGLTRYLDFSWMRNAYAADAIADALTEAGLVIFQLTSRDGWSRYGGTVETAHALYTPTAQGLALAGQALISSPAATAYLTRFPLSREGRYYTYADGSQRTAWLSPADGLDHNPWDALLLQSAACCADLLPAALSVWVDGDTAELKALHPATGVSWLVSDGGEITLDPEAAFVFQAAE